MRQLFATDNTATATMSADGVYRWDLTRRWNDGPRAIFLMLNPSVADAFILDPTVRRCVNFARRWGCGELVVLNIFALRSTNPAALKTHPDPVGPENDWYLRRWIGGADGPVVAAWGVHGTLGGRDQRVLELVRGLGVDLQCLKQTKDGHPGHPLYVKASQPLGRFL